MTFLCTLRLCIKVTFLKGAGTSYFSYFESKCSIWNTQSPSLIPEPVLPQVQIYCLGQKRRYPGRLTSESGSLVSVSCHSWSEVLLPQVILVLEIKNRKVTNCKNQ